MMVARSLKNLSIVVVFSCLAVSIYGQERIKVDLTGYETVLFEKAKITRKSLLTLLGTTKNFFIGYKMIKVKSSSGAAEKFISDIVYFLKDTQDSTYTILGKISAKEGFLDAFGKSITMDKSLQGGSAYLTKNISGFSISTLKDPFHISGSGIDSETGKVFETEFLIILDFDVNKISLTKFKPEI